MTEHSAEGQREAADPGAAPQGVALPCGSEHPEETASCPQESGVPGALALPLRALVTGEKPPTSV